MAAGRNYCSNNAVGVLQRTETYCGGALGLATYHTCSQSRRAWRRAWKPGLHPSLANVDVNNTVGRAWWTGAPSILCTSRRAVSLYRAPRWSRPQASSSPTTPRSHRCSTSNRSRFPIVLAFPAAPKAVVSGEVCDLLWRFCSYCGAQTG